MTERKYYVCPHCGNFVTMIKASGVPMVCCGEKMKQVTANTTEASTEKHLPVVEINGNEVIVTVGSVEHPMTEDHYIEWIYIQTENGGQAKCLNPGDKPQVVFTLNDDKVVAAYEYCNLHGLWLTKVE